MYSFHRRHIAIESDDEDYEALITGSEKKVIRKKLPIVVPKSPRIFGRRSSNKGNEHARETSEHLQEGDSECHDEDPLRQVFGSPKKSPGKPIVKVRKPVNATAEAKEGFSNDHSDNHLEEQSSPKKRIVKKNVSNNDGNTPITTPRKKISNRSPNSHLSPKTPSTTSHDVTEMTERRSHSSQTILHTPQTPSSSYTHKSPSPTGMIPKPPVHISPLKKKRSKVTLHSDLEQISPRKPRPCDFFDSGEFPKTPSVQYKSLGKDHKWNDLIEKSEEYFEGNKQTSPRKGSSEDDTQLYYYARHCYWEKVSEQVKEFPRDAKYVSSKDGTTALHLAVMSRSNPMMRDGELGDYRPAPLNLIEELVEACPEAAIIRCSMKKYTPLSYACLVADRKYDMDDASEMVRILLHHAPESAFVFTDEGFSALDVHILSYSQCHGEKEEVFSRGRTSTVVIRTLLALKPQLADARVYTNKVRGPIELLYRCNKEEFNVAMNDGSVSSAEDGPVRPTPSRFGSVTSTLGDWWAWKWALLIMKYASLSGQKMGAPFNAVHAAARLVGCPLPILSLSLACFPQQVRERDPRDDIYNLPLHEVCAWRCDQEIISGDPFVLSRKAKAIERLLEEFPEAAKMTNNMGETPLQLAVETATPWHGGLESLVKACPKALKFPRKLRHDGERAGHLLSVSDHTSPSSVCSDYSDKDDPNIAIEGMYPFLVAAVLSHISGARQRPPSFLYVDQKKESHQDMLSRKDLQSFRTIYGLLRVRPSVLEQYRKDLAKYSK